jgi:hypothetical protein
MWVADTVTWQAHTVEVVGQSGLGACLCRSAQQVLHLSAGSSAPGAAPQRDVPRAARRQPRGEQQPQATGAARDGVRRPRLQQLALQIMTAVSWLAVSRDQKAKNPAAPP